MRTWRQGVIIATARRAQGSIRVLRQQSHIRRGPQITENDTVSPITAAGARPGRELLARTGLGSIWSWPAVFGPAILRHPPSVAESIVGPFPERCEQHTRPPRVVWQPVPGKPGVLLRLTSLHQPSPGVKRLRSSPSGRRPSHPSPRSLPLSHPALADAFVSYASPVAAPRSRRALRPWPGSSSRRVDRGAAVILLPVGIAVGLTSDGED